MNDNIILKLNHISKHYSGVKALDDINFELRRGEMHAICGENGAGKSTLIKILTGAIEPSDGDMEINGRVYPKSNPSLSLELGIRAIYQEFTLIPYLTVAENIFFGRELKKGILCDSKLMVEETQKLCEKIGVGINPKARVQTLGIAQRQIVEILKAISEQANIYIMDEPTAPLTINETKIFFDIIRHLKNSGATIVFISHRLEEVFELCDRVTVLCDGRHVVTKNISEINRKQLISYMVGRELNDNYPKGYNRREENLLEVRGLANGKLKKLDFNLKKGEILGIAGLVGSGRTALAMALFGAADSKSLSITLNGKPYTPSNPGCALKNKIGLIPEDRQNEGLILEMSVEQNITVSVLRKLSFGGLVIEKKHEKEIGDKYIKGLKIKTPSSKQTVDKLSGGNQQKVVLAKSLAADCDILIFDEPTRGIDVGAKQEIYLLMNEITEQGKGIIIVSSEMQELIGMSDRILVMNNGFIAGELEREQFSQEAILEYASLEGVQTNVMI